MLCGFCALLANAWLQNLWYCFEEMYHFPSEYEHMQILITNKQRYIANNCMELAVKYKMIDYERIEVLANGAFIALYGSCMFDSKNTKNALSRPDIIELDKQTKRMCLGCRYIILEEIEVNPATSKKKTTKLTNCRLLEKLVPMM
ncbi:hypothetical protein RFI_25268 [Reticulomyxa filosa]|uniref:Uncharacterized protein n=1 Tax=Reticulomyxa filosa TaxID=46433 RepID=X6MDL1_RETFI|nr:hypothetical protein RFI_25268 [Reticulomyxa filosa]|eukprot:ETO12108.1 hypothetical protein RFI_25268 [Reticulomyxa filosa]